MNSWEVTTIREIGKVFDGPHATPKTIDKGPVFLGIPSLNSGRLDLSNTRHVSEEDFVKWTKRVEPKAGDIVFSYETKIGEAAVIPEGLRCCLGRRMGLVRLNPDICDPRFFLYQYLSPNYQKFLASRTVHGATVDRLLLKDFPDFNFPLPQISEQREIASILGALDDKIELNRRMSATLEDMARSLYRSWFVDFDPVHAKMEGRQPAFMDEATAALFPDRFRDDGLPEGWEMNEIDSLCTIKGGKQLTKDRFVDDGAFPVFGGAGQMGMTNEFNADGYVVTVGRVGAYCGNFVAHRGKAWVNNNASLIEPLQQIPAEFLFLALTALDLSSIKKGAAQPFISNGDLKKLTTTIPDAPVLDAFNEKAKVFQLRTEALQSENQTLAALRDSLLPKLMSGELRVGEAREQVEEVA